MEQHLWASCLPPAAEHRLTGAVPNSDPWQTITSLVLVGLGLGVGEGLGLCNQIAISTRGVIIIIIIPYIYIALFWVLKALYMEGANSSSTTNVQHPPGWCDGSHIAPERSPHISLLVERRQSDEANQCMGMIRRPWWSEANGRIWPGCRDYTLTLFQRTSWDF